MDALSFIGNISSIIGAGLSLGLLILGKQMKKDIIDKLNEKREKIIYEKYFSSKLNGWIKLTKSYVSILSNGDNILGIENIVEMRSLFERLDKFKEQFNIKDRELIEEIITQLKNSKIDIEKLRENINLIDMKLNILKGPIYGRV